MGGRVPMHNYASLSPSVAPAPDAPLLARCSPLHATRDWAAPPGLVRRLESRHSFCFWQTHISLVVVGQPGRDGHRKFLGQFFSGEWPTGC